MLLGQETSGNHQAYSRGHLDITILNKIRAAKGVLFNSFIYCLLSQSQTLFGKLQAKYFRVCRGDLQKR